MCELNKSKLKERLSGKLPGKEAQLIMAPTGRHVQVMSDGCREAAVLILVFPENKNCHLVLIKRNEYDGHHSGQVSFPGGMKELSDFNFSETALRETKEEIGVPSENIEILGLLTPLYIPVSKICVHPFVGWIDQPPIFEIDNSEVQYFLCPSINDIRDKNNLKRGNIVHRDKTIITPYFELENEIIWGATAMMLNEFISVLDF